MHKKRRTAVDGKRILPYKNFLIFIVICIEKQPGTYPGLLFVHRGLSIFSDLYYDRLAKSSYMNNRTGGKR
jgi:hypothetical protein